MHVSSVWMPLAAARGCSLLLHSLWTHDLSYKIKIQLSVKCSKVRVSFGSARGSCDNPATTNVALNITERHLLPKQHSTLRWLLKTVPERNDKWKWYCVYGRPRPACDFQLQCWCGLARVVLEGRPGAAAVWFGIFFPPEANGISLMEPHNVFQLSHLTMQQSSLSSLACTT